MSKALSGVGIGVAMTGSFCTFEKTFRCIDQLRQRGAQLLPIMSYHAYSMDTRFFTAEEARRRLAELCGRESLHEIVEVEPIGPKKLIDLLLIAPCTGNTIAKIANGIADTAVTMAAKSQLRNQRPVLIGLSTNDGLSNNAANIGKLMSRKHVFFAPFYQDDPQGKPSSLIFDEEAMMDAVTAALKQEQIQPLIRVH